MTLTLGYKRINDPNWKCRGKVGIFPKKMRNEEKRREKKKSAEEEQAPSYSEGDGREIRRGGGGRKL